MFDVVHFDVPPYRFVSRRSIEERQLIESDLKGAESELIFILNRMNDLRDPPGDEIAERERRLLDQKKANLNRIIEELKLSLSDDFIDTDARDLEYLELLFEETIFAINESIVFSRAIDSAQDSTPFNVRIGRASIKAFLVAGQDGRVSAGWINPRFSVGGIATALGMFGGMRISPNPMTNPICPFSKRWAAVFDLLSLDFHTEAFIVAFSMLDDLIQNIVDHAFGEMGLDKSQRKRMIRGIKENRFDIYLNEVLLLCGGKSLEQDRSDLMKQIRNANSLRNSIVHGDEQLDFRKALEHINSIWMTIEWLRLVSSSSGGSDKDRRPNALTYRIPLAPQMEIARLKFSIFPDDSHPLSKIDRMSRPWL